MGLHKLWASFHSPSHTPSAWKQGMHRNSNLPHLGAALSVRTPAVLPALPAGRSSSRAPAAARRTASLLVLLMSCCRAATPPAAMMAA